MSEELKRWIFKRKAALVIELLKGQTTIAEASRQYDLTPSEIQSWIDDAQNGMENALRAKPKDICEQYEQKITELTSAYTRHSKNVFIIIDLNQCEMRSASLVIGSNFITKKDPINHWG